MRFNVIGACYRNAKHNKINGDVHTEYLTFSQVIDFDKNDVMNATQPNYIIRCVLGLL